MHTFRIFINNQDQLMLTEMAKTHKVELIVGGPPLKVPRRDVYLRFPKRSDWMVCYLKGSLVQISDLDDAWLKYLRETRDEYA